MCYCACGNRLIKGCRHDAVRSAWGRQVVDHRMNKVMQHDKLVLVGEFLWLSRVVRHRRWLRAQAQALKC